MSRVIYIQPTSCIKDKCYYLKTGRNDRGPIYQEVRFVSYRPHPAEILVDDGNQIRMVHRSLLFTKRSGNGRIT